MILLQDEKLPAVDKPSAEANYKGPKVLYWMVKQQGVGDTGGTYELQRFFFWYVEISQFYF